MWKIEYSAEALRDLHKLDKSTVKRIVKKLELAAQNPTRYFERLVGYEDYKLRVGDYRIIALLLHEKRIIYVEKVGHRRSIYK
ncbi:MAG: type II toxin-antitoxin system RelE/ParE family toxin [Candidatus Micrarchaeia archaeon]